MWTQTAVTQGLVIWGQCRWDISITVTPNLKRCSCQRRWSGNSPLMTETTHLNPEAGTYHSFVFFICLWDLVFFGRWQIYLDTDWRFTNNDSLSKQWRGKMLLRKTIISTDKQIHRRAFMNCKERYQLPMSLCSYTLQSWVYISFAVYLLSSEIKQVHQPLSILNRSQIQAPLSLIPLVSEWVLCICWIYTNHPRGGEGTLLFFLFPLCHGLTLCWDSELIMHFVSVHCVWVCCVCLHSAGCLRLVFGGSSSVDRVFGIHLTWASLPAREAPASDWHGAHAPRRAWLGEL